MLARVCNFFLEQHEQGCSRKMAEISEYLQKTQPAGEASDTDSSSDTDMEPSQKFGKYGLKDGPNGKKNMIVKVCDFFLDKKERGNEINIRAIITAIDHASTTAVLSPVERKAVEDKQRELLLKLCKLLLDTKERGVEANIQEISNAIRFTKVTDPIINAKVEEMDIESSFEIEPESRNSEWELKKRKMVVYKFFLDSRERGCEDKTGQINRMLKSTSS